MGRAHDDRYAGGLRIALDGLGGLHAVHSGHQVIHEDDVRMLTAAEKLQGLFGRAGHTDVHVEVLQQLAQGKPGYLGVIHQKSILDRHLTTSSCYFNRVGYRAGVTSLSVSGIVLPCNSCPNNTCRALWCG